MLAFKKEKTDPEIGAIDAPEEVGKRLEVRFNRSYSPILDIFGGLRTNFSSLQCELP